MTQDQLLINVALAAWNTAIGRADKAFSALSDEQFLREVAPGKNRMIYLLGHLAAVNDGIHTLLGLGDRVCPEYDAIFLTKPDKAVPALPSVPELRKRWTDVNKSLGEKFARLSPQEWLQRHTAMSDEDYAKDPTRNRLSVVLGRASHVAYHLGQINLAPK